MAFQKQAPRVPKGIGPIIVELIDRPATTDAPALQSISAQITILDENGRQIEMLTFNLAPHLTAQMLNQIGTFMANVRAKAVTELIGD